jgi:hypothetical protein
MPALLRRMSAHQHPRTVNLATLATIRGHAEEISEIPAIIAVAFS